MHKRAARAHRACDRVWRRPRRPAELLQRAGARGDNLGSITAALMRLLERWGASALQAAITEALARDVPHPNAVRLALERASARPAAEPPPVALVLPEHVARRDAPVRTTSCAPMTVIPTSKPTPPPQESPDE
jgi:hypothetical protein